MLMGIYFFAVFVVYLFTRFILISIVQRDTAVYATHNLTQYSRRMLLLTLVCFAVFTGLSTWQGLIKFGTLTNFRFPQDYLEAGPAGWIILIIGLIGILSPIIAMIWINNSVIPE